ncbi:MAG TPA: SDR family NAD(P)-dependent oxidoreductase [Bacteroidia bacterium]|nr:SDR family NAD(P)-dependent oxidoreductase [Bacteroidia bacterium]
MKKTVLLTGATGAIGKATAIALANANCSLILFGRNAAKLAQVKSEIIQATANKDLETYVADLSEPKSIRQAVAQIRKTHSSLNALVNIAAVFSRQRTENSQGLEYTFATNHLGPFVLTNELLDLLKAGKPARVITVSAPSTTKVNFEDINGKTKYSSGFLGAFGASKMMNIMFTYALARRLQGTGVSTSVFHPGLVKSELTRDMPKLLYYLFRAISSPPDKAAKMLCRLAIDPAYENSNGTFWKVDGKEIKSSGYSYDKDLQEKLWTLSEQLSNS